MAKKKLILNESATRRFMKLATIKPTYVSNFLKEQEEDEMDAMGAPADAPADEPAPDDMAADADPMMDPGMEVEDEMDDPVEDEGAEAEDMVMDLLGAVQSWAKSKGVSMELEGDEGDDDDDDMDVEMDDADPEGGELPDDAGMDADMGDDAPAEGGDDELDALQEAEHEAKEDEANEDEKEKEVKKESLFDEESIVAEVTKRVAKRLLKESAKTK